MEALGRTRLLQGGHSAWHLWKSSSYKIREGVFLDRTNLRNLAVSLPAAPWFVSGLPGVWGCSDPHPDPGGGGWKAAPRWLTSTSQSRQTSLQLCWVLAANLAAKLNPRLQGGGQAGEETDLGVSFIISCFNFHSAQILHPA